MRRRRRRRPSTTTAPPTTRPPPTDDRPPPPTTIAPTTTTRARRRRRSPTCSSASTGSRRRTRHRVPTRRSGSSAVRRSRESNRVVLDDVVAHRRRQRAGSRLPLVSRSGWGDDPVHGERGPCPIRGRRNARRAPARRRCSRRVHRRSDRDGRIAGRRSPGRDLLRRGHQPSDAECWAARVQRSSRRSSSPRSTRRSALSPTVGRDAELVRRSVTPAALCYRWDNVWLSAPRSRPNPPRCRAQCRAADDPPGLDPPDRPVDRTNRPR